MRSFLPSEIRDRYYVIASALALVLLIVWGMYARAKAHAVEAKSSRSVSILDCAQMRLTV